MKSPEQSQQENYNSTFENRISALISNAKQGEDISDEDIRKVEKFQSLVSDIFSPEIIKYISSLDDEDFKTIIKTVFQNVTSEAKREGVEAYHKEISIDTIKNTLLYDKVYGYGHPDLEKRKKENPIPTTEELMLGCYIEQIEAQTRSSVLTMRSKGYDTVQSGFYDVAKGSQFFDIYEDTQSQVPDALIDEMLQKFEVTITVKRSLLDRTDIILTPKQYKDISEWKEALDYFADAIPTKGNQEFGAYGMGIQFAHNTIKKYPIETILMTAKTERQKEQIKSLYTCRTKEDIIKLFNTEPDTAEQMIIQDELVSDTLEFKNMQSHFNLYSHVSNKESILEGLELMKHEYQILSDKYANVEDKKTYLETIKRAIRYMQGHLANSH